MATKTLRVGIVGHGFMGKVHGHAYRSLGFYYDPAPARVVTAAIATRTETSLKRAMDEWGFEFGTTDFRELCQRDDIDIVDCCTPNNSHKDVLLEALRCGKHVYMDKPLASTIEDAREMARCAARYPTLVTQMAFQYRFIPAVLRARALLDEHALGRILTARVAYLHAGYIDPERPFSWRLDREVSGKGGSIFDLGSHVVDLTRFLLGELRSIQCVTETFFKDRPLREDPSTRVPVEVDDVALMVFRLDSGGLGTLEASRVATGVQDEMRFEIHGEKGAIRFNLMQPNFLEFYDASKPEGPYGGDRGFRAIESVARYPKPSALPGPKNTVGWERFHVHSIYNFISRVVDGTPASPDIVDGLRTQAVLEAALKSSETGVWVDVERFSSP